MTATTSRSITIGVIRPRVLSYTSPWLRHISYSIWSGYQVSLSLSILFPITFRLFCCRYHNWRASYYSLLFVHCVYLYGVCITRAKKYFLCVYKRLQRGTYSVGLYSSWITFYRNSLRSYGWFRYPVNFSQFFCPTLRPTFFSLALKIV